MELTMYERLNLINQYEILKHIDPHEEKHYEKLIKILVYGYKTCYSEITEWINEEIPDDECRLVLDILSLYRAVETYKRDNPDDHEVNNHDYSHFRGFDGNEETNFLSYTRFLLEDQDKFNEQIVYAKQTDNFNSHSHMLSKYRSMINFWNITGHKYELSKDTVLGILNAHD